ncbi:hypothetical protein [Bartonella sp. LJL80]
MKKVLSLALVTFLFGTPAAFAADCAEVGKRVADEQGGTLTRSTQVSQNGNDMCVVVVLIPARDGEKPRRVEVAVPAN